MKKLLPHLLIALLIVGCATKIIEIKEITAERIERERAELNALHDEDGNTKLIPYDRPPKLKKPFKPEYPETAQERGIEGTVYMLFFINDKGIVNSQSISVRKGISELNEAGINAVLNSKWIPAMQKDKKVGVWQILPIKFELSSNMNAKKSKNRKRYPVQPK